MIWCSKPVGVALVGCGNMGRVHAQAIQHNKRCRLLWVFDPERVRADQVLREVSAKRVAEHLETILEDPKVEGVILATPHHLHFEQVLQALDAGKHVLVEKPMALNGEQARQLCEHARAVNRRLLVGQVMRFWPNVQKARQSIQEGQIGRLRHVIRRRLVYQRDAGRPWAHQPDKSGGWLIHGVTVHEVDALLYITGLQIKRVYALATCNNPIWQDIDELSAVLEFEDGVVCSLTHSLNSHVTLLETTVIGDKGSIFLRDWNRGYALNGEWEILGDNQGFGDQLMDFIRAIREETISRVDAKSILPTMLILDSIHMSASQGEIINVSPFEIHSVKGNEL